MKIKTDYGYLELDFVPQNYKTAAGAAKGFYKALMRFASEVYGQEDPSKEMFIHNPEQSAANGYGNVWRVCWESGPFEWAIPASFEVRAADYSWHTEPYYSFDLCFYNN